MNENKTIIIGHRGAPIDAGSENSLESFGKAIELGADMIEFDVRKTKDNILVTYHDPKIDVYRLSDLTCNQANELIREKRSRIPKLSEVLEFTDGRIDLDIELKEPGYEHEVLKLLDRHYHSGEYIITSFKEQILSRIKKLSTESKVGLLIGVQNLFCPNCRVFSFSSRVNCVPADCLVLHWSLLRFGILKRLMKESIPVIVWTVNDTKMLRYLLSQNIKGIITDHVSLAAAPTLVSSS
ncbi:MAG: glycerophosphodiester phosphodiesterase [candidate division Zixibacteria bacterium]|nr:glycerophosphodiester phosphodiesterase [candidate division Zixibacteria bacterium]